MELEVDFKQPFAQTGIVASIGSGEPVFGLTADMDALPIQVTDFHDSSASSISAYYPWNRFSNVLV